MKTILSTFFIIALSFISIKAIVPKEYPPKSVKEEIIAIRLKEQIINNAIHKNDYILEVNCMNIAEIQKKENGK
jgi:hypothetical protein